MLQRAEGEVKWQELRFLLMFVMTNEFQFESGKVFGELCVSLRCPKKRKVYFD